MAHHLQNSNDMFYVGQTPWHHLGTSLTNPPTTAEALKQANMDWSVAKRPLFNEHGEQSTHSETFRTDNNKVLGVVGPRYTILQNTEAFSLVDPLIAEGLMQYETAGILDGGCKVWLLAKPKGDDIEIVKDDPVRSYLLLTHGHDGTLAVRIGLTPVRVVCWNTLSAAISNKENKHMYKLRHTKSIKASIKALIDVFAEMQRAFIQATSAYQMLATVQVKSEDLTGFVNEVFGEKTQDPTRNTIERLFVSGVGQDLPAVKGTAWALYNAATEYLQTERGRTAESRLASCTDGANAITNDAALKYCLGMLK